MMNLGNLKKAKGSTKDKRRVGRGKASGTGNQAGKGHDGQKGRSGNPRPYAGFEGGQMRLIRLIPKRGFWSPNRTEYYVVNLSDLENTFEANETVTLDVMVEKGLVKSLKKPVKILARGEITKPLTVSANRFSESAKAKIEKAGGKVEVV